MNQVPNVLVPPYPAVGLLMMRFTAGWASGTGALIGPRQIVTCAHNLYDQEEQEAALRVCFYPAWNAAWPNPPGGRAAIAAYYAAPYAQGQDAWDVGFVRLAAAVNPAPQFYFTPTDTGAEIDGHEVNVTGYPGIYGGCMGTDLDEVANIIVQDNLMNYTNDTWAGSSGGPVWTVRHGMAPADDVVELRGIHTSLDDGTLRQGRLMTPAVHAWIDLAAEQVPPNAFAAVALEPAP